MDEIAEQIAERVRDLIQPYKERIAELEAKLAKREQQDRAGVDEIETYKRRERRWKKKVADLLASMEIEPSDPEPEPQTDPEPESKPTVERQAPPPEPPQEPKGDPLELRVTNAGRDIYLALVDDGGYVDAEAMKDRVGLKSKQGVVDWYKALAVAGLVVWTQRPDRACALPLSHLTADGRRAVAAIRSKVGQNLGIRPKSLRTEAGKAEPEPEPATKTSPTPQEIEDAIMAVLEPEGVWEEYPMGTYRPSLTLSEITRKLSPVFAHIDSKIFARALTRLRVRGKVKYDVLGWVSVEAEVHFEESKARYKSEKAERRAKAPAGEELNKTLAASLNELGFTNLPPDLTKADGQKLESVFRMFRDPTTPVQLKPKLAGEAAKVQARYRQHAWDRVATS